MHNCEVLVFGELLWDLLPSGAVLGGAPANFAYRLNSLGVRASLVSRIGQDQLGDEAISMLKEKGVDCSFLQNDKEHATGTVSVNIDASGNASYEIHGPVAYDFIECSENLETLAKKVRLVYFGTLAQRNKRSRETLSRLLSLAVDAAKFVDINLRRDCYDRKSVEYSFEQATIVKINEQEINVVSEMFGIELKSYPDFAAKLLKKFSLDECLLTFGEFGAYALNNDGQQIHVPGLKVPIIDTIGSGDAFSAGFVAGLLQGQDLTSRAISSNALAAAVVGTCGAMEKVNPAETSLLVKSTDNILRTEEAGSVSKIGRLNF